MILISEKHSSFGSVTNVTETFTQKQYLHNCKKEGNENDGNDRTKAKMGIPQDRTVK